MADILKEVPISFSSSTWFFCSNPDLFSRAFDFIFVAPNFIFLAPDLFFVAPDFIL